MNNTRLYVRIKLLLTALSLIFSASVSAQKLKISGIYPNLVMYNYEGMENNFGEAGIGALVPWGDQLWGITYTCHALRGSSDKLYQIDENLHKTIRPESVGGTHANRMIHQESKQLIIGPYFIREDGTVRVAKFPDRKYGRLTATTRHLTSPDSMVYFYDMEGIWYEVDVYSLAVTKLHNKPVPGWHGKGAYVGQGKFVVANNGLHGAPSPYWKSPRKDPEVANMLEEGYETRYEDQDDPENTGILAEYDGESWKVIEARQYTDVSGPGGLSGNQTESDPVWAIGWDKRSLRLKVLDNGNWHTYLLPKASHTFEHESGVFTEWPRFREVGQDRWLLDMFGMFFHWPQGFNTDNSSGIYPVSSHLRYIPDFGHWNGEVFLAADDAAKVTNPIPPGLNQSNIWFGQYEELQDFGPSYAWGGPWLEDAIKANEKSLPFLINGFHHKMIHLQHNLDEPVDFVLEVDRVGDNQWEELATVTVSKSGYSYFLFPDDVQSNWIRLSASKDCQATAYLFLHNPYEPRKKLTQKFESLAEIDNPATFNTGLVWPDTMLSLQFHQQHVTASATESSVKQVAYHQEKDDIAFSESSPSNSQDVQEVLPVKERGFDIDEASVIYTYNGKKYRLPKGHENYDQELAEGYLRSHREVQSERALLNIHGTFYEVPRERVGIPAIKPISSHNKRVKDYCSWRGLLVMSGTKAAATPDGNYFGSSESGLWLGKVDDLWHLGKPVGTGGPLYQTQIEADTPSDPYLMTLYDKKSVNLSHDQPNEVTFTIEINFTHRGNWAELESIVVPAREEVSYSFPEGYQAHWVRVKTSEDCKATAQFIYE
ncbi:MAG: hypothetical protein AAF632_20880 [Bacteroidota bacterium]